MDRRLFLKNSAIILSLPLWSQGLIESALAAPQGVPFSKTKVFPGKFSAQEHLIFESLIDVIIPRSDTPGAIDAEVPDFIQRLLDVSSPKTQQEFDHGFAAFQNWSQSTSKKSFLILSPSEKLASVNSLFSSPEVPVVSDWMKTLKILTLFGYRNWSQSFNQTGLTTRYLGPEEQP